MEQASTIVVNRLGLLGRTFQFEWGTVVFASGDLAVGETRELAKWFTARLTNDASHHRDWGGYWLKQANFSRPAPLLEQHLLRYVRQENTALVGAMRGAQSWGFAVKVLRFGGPIVAVIGATWDVYQGDPPEKAIFTAGVGLAAGIALAVLIPGPGWAVLAGGAIVGGIVGVGAGAAYDMTHPPTARDVLFGDAEW